MSDPIRLTPNELKTLKEGMRRGSEDREKRQLLDEEVSLLKEALSLDKYDVIPDVNVRYKDIDHLTEKYEDKRLKELKKLTVSVHNPSGTRDEIEASK